MCVAGGLHFIPSMFSCFHSVFLALSWLVGLFVLPFATSAVAHDAVHPPVLRGVI